MSLSIQMLEDSSEDDSPLFDFLLWLKEHNVWDAFECSLTDESVSIYDFAILTKQIEDYKKMHPDVPQPPDIRKWLREQRNAHRYYAWVGY